jgi:hypothetical protein
MRWWRARVAPEVRLAWQLRTLRRTARARPAPELRVAGTPYRSSQPGRLSPPPDPRKPEESPQTLVVVSGVSLDGSVPDQELLPGTVPGDGCVAPRLRRGPFGVPPGSENGPKRTIDDLLSASPAPPLLAVHHRAIKTATVEGALAVTPRTSDGTQTVPGRPDRRGVRWMSAMRLRLGRACLLGGLGRSLATRPRAVTPSDPPARGDQPSARIGIRQGPQMQLLAEARRPLSVHPADLRPPLPGVPRPWAAVLQPRRPPVPGARHRAAGGGAGPAVAGQGGGQAPHRPRSSGP